MKKLEIILTVLSLVLSVVLTENQPECELKDSETCKKLNQSEILAVLVNSSKIQLNNSELSEIIDVSRINLDLDLNLENVTLEEISTKITKGKDQYFFGARRRACLENVTKCLNEDVSFRSKGEKLGRLLFSMSPPFDLSKVPGVSETCKSQSTFFKKELQRFSFWALKMYDATAKLPSGLLSGNVNQLGDFDMCLAATSPQREVRGKYCLAYLQVDTPLDSPYMDVLHDLVHGHLPFRSQLNDPGHRVPRYSTINWALCVPSGCSTKDVELGIEAFTESHLEPLGLQIQVQVNEEMCQVKEENPIEKLPTSTIIGGAFFLGILLITFLATMYDYKASQPKSDIFMAFSLRKNLKSLLSLDRPENDIASVHGIRFLNAFMLIAAHKSMALFFNPYINRVEMSEILGQPWSVIGRAASLYTDPFIMLSGMLTAHSIFGKLNRTGKLDVFQEYMSRIFRLVPTLGALIMFCTLVLPWLGSGPQWNLVVTHHSDICKQTWWRNILFIHNYYGFENMCLTHTHHLGIDTQLFAVSPLLIWIVWKWPKKGSITLVAIATISTIMRYYTTYILKLNNYVHFGTSIRQLFDTADFMYILPAYRITVYILGILLGYVLRNAKRIEINKAQIRIGDAIATFLFCLAFFGPAFMGSMDYKYNPTDAAAYAAFAPIAWCLSFAWVIYKSHFGHESALGKFFSARVFLITTRLSYAIYLTQFPIFFYNVGVTRSTEQYTFFRLQINIPELINIIFYSAILTLLFDTPFQNIKKIIFRRPKRIVKDNNNVAENGKNVVVKDVKSD